MEAVETVVDQSQIETTQQTQQTQPETKPRFEDQHEKVFKHGQKEAFNLVDDAVKRFGFEKPDNVKTSEFVAQVLEKLTKAPTTTQQPQSTDDQITKDKYVALKEQYDSLKTDYTRKISEYEQRQADIAIQSTIENLAISAPPSLPEEAINSHLKVVRESIQAQFKNNFETKMVDGKQVYYDKAKGTPVLNEDGNFASAKETITKYFPHYFVKYETPQTKKVGVTTPDSVNTQSETKFKTQAEIHSFLAKTKPDLKFGTLDYMNEVIRLKKESGL
jgi:hypothetical protein